MARNKPRRFERLTWQAVQTFESPNGVHKALQRGSLNYKWLSEKYGLPLLSISFLFGLGAKQVYDGHTPWFLVVVLVFILILVLIFMSDFVANFRNNLPLDRDTILLKDKKLMRSTQLLLEAHGGIFDFAAGSACEFIRHPYLGKRLIDNGWSPKNFIIEFDGVTIDLPSFSSDEKDPKGNNGPKYVLRRAFQPMSDDSEKLQVVIAKTNWYDVMKTRDRLKNDESLRHKKIAETISELGVNKNSIPSSFCLHFVCVLGDGSILAQKRRGDVAYYPGALSISFEEQIAEMDVWQGDDDRAEFWFRRSICEEIFGLEGIFDENPDQCWNNVKDHVEFKRYWTIFLEEDTGNISTFGVVKLKFTPQEFPRIFREVYPDRKDEKLLEGQLYSLSRNQIKDILEDKSICATKLTASGLEEVVSFEYLHPTTLYRLAYVGSCLF